MHAVLVFYFFVTESLIEEQKLGSPEADTSDAESPLPSDGLHLRKRTFRGRDYVLKRTVNLLSKLSTEYRYLQKQQQLQQQQQQQQQQEHEAEPPSKRAATGLLPSNFTHPQLRAGRQHTELDQRSAVPSSFWPIRAFLDVPVCRYLCRIPPGRYVQEVQLVDTNDRWSEALGLQREQMLGRPVRDFLAPVNWHRWVFGASMVLKHGMIVVRNAPSYKANRIIDVIAWAEYDTDDNHDSVVSAAEEPLTVFDVSIHQERKDLNGNIQRRWPKYLQLMHFNERPFLESTPAAREESGSTTHLVTGATSLPSTDIGSLNCFNFDSPQPMHTNDQPQGSGTVVACDWKFQGTPWRTVTDGQSMQAYTAPLMSPAGSVRSDNVDGFVTGTLQQGPSTLNSVGDPDVLNLADQCAVFLRLDQATSAPRDEDDEDKVFLSPWSSDGSGERNVSGPLPAIKRSELSRSVPHLLHELPDLLSPVASASTMEAELSFCSSAYATSASSVSAPFHFDAAALDSMSAARSAHDSLRQQPEVRYYSLAEPQLDGASGHA